MSARTRWLNVGVIGALVGTIVVPVVTGHLAPAGPIGAVGPPSTPPAESPPSTPPAGSPPSTPPAESEGTQADEQGTQGIELVEGLGSGGQPADVPRELVIGGDRFLFDRIVPLRRQELIRVAQEQSTIAFARSEEGPFAAIYLSVPERGEDELARYLPEAVGSSDVVCPAEVASFERVDVGGALYAFAGNETDLTVDSLREVGDNNGEPVYADVDSAQPFPELFFGSGGGLLRFVLVGDDGRPSSIAESLAFNGTELAFASDATEDVDPAALTKVGCSTAFPVYAPAGAADGSLTQLYVLVGTRYFLFTGEGAAPATTSPTSTSTTTTEPPTTTSTTTTTELPTTTTTEPPTTTTTTQPPTTTTTTEPPTTTTTTEPPTTTSTSTSTTTTTTEPATTTSTTTTTEATTTTSTSTTTPTTTVPPTTTSTTSTSSPTTTEATTTTSTSTTTPTTEPPTTTTTIGIEPPAVVATLPPGAPPPAASNAIPQTTCTGEPGGLDARGIPAHLPTRIQLGGVAYVFVRAEAPDAVGALTRIGCIGPFAVARTDLADQSQVIYLRATASGAASQQVYRFEAALTFQIDFQVTDQPQVITSADQSYRLSQVWQPSVYSSTSVILFVEDPASPAPDIIYALDVSQTVVGDAIGEYRRPAETAQPSEEMVVAAELSGLHPDLTINGQVYVLVNIFTPTGTTRNGFMTLFGTAEGTQDLLLGRDQRERELFVFLQEFAP